MTSFTSTVLSQLLYSVGKAKRPNTLLGSLVEMGQEQRGTAGSGIR